MKKLLMPLSLLLLAISLIHCEGNIISDNDPCKNNYIQPLNQYISVMYLDSLGNNLLNPATANTPFDPSYFSIWATDENFNMLYNDIGEPLIDLLYKVSYEEGRDSLRQLWTIRFFLLHKYRELPNHQAQSFYLFQINKHQVDTIIAYYDIRCKSFEPKTTHYKGHTLKTYF